MDPMALFNQSQLHTANDTRLSQATSHNAPSALTNGGQVMGMQSLTHPNHHTAFQLPAGACLSASAQLSFAQQQGQRQRPSSRLQATTRGADIINPIDSGHQPDFMTPSTAAGSLGFNRPDAPGNQQQPNCAERNSQQAYLMAALGGPDVTAAPAASAVSHDNGNHSAYNAPDRWQAKTTDESPKPAPTAPAAGPQAPAPAPTMAQAEAQAPLSAPAPFLFPGNLSLSQQLELLAKHLQNSSPEAAAAAAAGSGTTYNPPQGQPNNFFMPDNLHGPELYPGSWGQPQGTPATTSSQGRASNCSGGAAAAADAPEKACSHCGKVEQRQWRKRGDGTFLCNRCFMWRRNHGGELLPPLDNTHQPGARHYNSSGSSSGGRGGRNSHSSSKGAPHYDSRGYAMPATPDLIMPGGPTTGPPAAAGSYSAGAVAPHRTRRYSNADFHGHNTNNHDDGQYWAPAAAAKKAKPSRSSGSGQAGGQQQGTKRPYHSYSLTAEEQEVADAAEVLADLLPKAVSASSQQLSQDTYVVQRSNSRGRRRAVLQEEAVPSPDTPTSMLSPLKGVFGGAPLPENVEFLAPEASLAAGLGPGPENGGWNGGVDGDSVHARAAGVNSSSAQIDSGSRAGGGPELAAGTAVAVSEAAAGVVAAASATAAAHGSDGVGASGSAQEMPVMPAAAAAGAGGPAVPAVPEISSHVCQAYFAAVLAGVPPAQMDLPAIQRSFEAMRQRLCGSGDAQQLLACMMQATSG